MKTRFSRGKPANLTEEMHEKIIEAISKVVSFRQVAAYVGMPFTTLDTWIQRGKKELLQDKESAYVDLYVDYKMAQAKFVEKQISVVSRGAERWQAAAWLLERCFRLDFGLDGHEIMDLKKQLDEVKELLKLQNKIKQKDDDNE